MLGLLPVVNNAEAVHHIKQGPKYAIVSIKYKIKKGAENYLIKVSC